LTGVGASGFMRAMSPKWTMLAALVLTASLASGCSSCSKDAPKSSRWDDAATAAATAATGATGATAAAAASDTAPSAATPAVATIPAGTFNKFFPKDGEGGFKRVFAADKEGFAEAKLQKDGTEVAVLSISDAEKLVYAKAKFESATDKLDGYPLMTVGNNQTTVLVNGRYQVKVSSKTLDHEARKAILTTFDLKGLSTL
jgi:hypothetical protein